jgi:hypothetical protein
VRGILHPGAKTSRRSGFRGFCISCGDCAFRKAFRRFALQRRSSEGVPHARAKLDILHSGRAANYGNSRLAAAPVRAKCVELSSDFDAFVRAWTEDRPTDCIRSDKLPKNVRRNRDVYISTVDVQIQEASGTTVPKSITSFKARPRQACSIHARCAHRWQYDIKFSLFRDGWPHVYLSK